MKDSQQEIEELRLEIASLTRGNETLHKLINEQLAEISILKSGGCARNKGATQFCAEAVEIGEKLGAMQRHVNLCRNIVKCPDDETLAVCLEDQQARIGRLILERDRWQEKAEEKIALRREIETALGIETGDTNDEALAKGLKALRHMVHLDDPVVTGLVDILERIDAAGRDHGSDPLTGEACGCESCENYFAISKALSAYEARVKEVSRE